MRDALLGFLLGATVAHAADQTLLGDQLHGGLLDTSFSGGFYSQ